MGPQVSICIPAYTRAASLRQAIASVLAQTWTGSIEVVVTDDSGDLGAVAEEFRSDARVRYHANPKRLGMAGNWNRALDLAEGEYVGLLMDDDRLHPAFLAEVMRRFELDPGVDVVFTDHDWDVAGVLRPRQCRLAGGTYDDFVVPLLRHRPVPVSATVMRRSALATALPLPDLQTADMALHLTLAQAGHRFHYVARPLMTYRVHDEQLSGDLGFRDEAVRLWERFSFDDREAEQLRRRYLGEGYVARGLARARTGDHAGARADGEAARSLVRLRDSPRSAVLRLLLRRPGLAAALHRSVAIVRPLGDTLRRRTRS
jgi:glycosyltransferase involved in cell wall biosynthesis